VNIPRIIPAIALATMFAPAGHAAISLTSGLSANELVNTLLGSSSGISFSNASVVGASSQYGTFAGGTSAGLPFDSGVVLSSGLLSDLGLSSIGSDVGASGFLNTNGDAKLTALNNEVTNDAAVLKFDFVPNGDKVQFFYVFGSTEYNEFVNSEFNDVFGFFVNDVNYALVPGTSTPVSVNSVNCGENKGPTSAASPGLGATASCDKFVNNRLDNDSVGSSALVNPGGFTKSFSFIADVTPNQTNTIYLAIADVEDDILDSAVFISGKSFRTCGGPGQPTCGSDADDDGGDDDGGGTPVSEPGSITLLGLALALAVRRKFRK